MQSTWALSSRETAESSAIETFVYLAEHGLIVCREHGYAVRKLDRHLLESHVYSATIRRAIKRHFEDCALIDLRDVVLPKAYNPAIPALAAPRKGLLCDEDDCGHISIRRTTIAEHCRTHGWRSSPDDREHWIEVGVQSFCLTPGMQRWFPVSVDDPSKANDTSDVPDELQGQKAIIVRRFEQMRAKRKQEEDVLDAEMAKTDRTGWWKRTDWPAHLEKSNLQHLAHASRLPDKDERVLVQVAELVDKVIERCVKGLSSLPLELRRWLKSVKMEEVDQRPMGRLQNMNSQDRYATYWKRLICYALRVVQSEPAPDVAHPPAGRNRDTMVDARRLFPWREGQKESARQLLRRLEGVGVGSAAAALLELSGTFIFQKLYHQPFESPMLHFLAVLGIDGENGRLREANDYSYMLAGVVYCTRVIALEMLLPSESRASQGVPEFDDFLQKRKDFLADGSTSVVSNMISLLAYGKHIALNHGNAGAVFWEKCDRVMKLHGARIVMEKFKETIARAVNDAEDLFWERLMWTKDPAKRFAVDINALDDDVTFRKRDAYFVNSKDNGLGSKWIDVTLARMLGSREGRKMCTGDTWHTRRAREYLRRVDQLRKLLLFCVHTSGGQPARGSEILSLRFKNGYLRDRNIFILDGYVMTVTFYNKTEAEWDIPKVVPRFLPWRVGQLLALYLIYVQPFMELLSVEIGHGCGWSEYVWADDKGPWETPKLTSILRQRTGEGIGHAMGTLDFRHAAVGIGRKYVGDAFARGYKDETGEVEEPEVELDDPLEISAGRGSAVGVNRYAVRSDIVRHLSQRNIDTFRPLSESWHRFLGLQSRGTVPVKGGEKRPAPAMQTPMAKKPKISWAGGLATPMTVTPNVVAPPIRAGPASSPPALSSPTRAPRPVRSARPDAEQRQRAVRKALGLSDEDPVNYKSAEQAQALDRIMDRTDSALAVILPTGGGKSLLFTAPACLDDPGMAIVVVPYRQLINETVAGARARGIDAVEWDSQVRDPADIVFVSADKLHKVFFDYAARMVGKGLLRRVFVDECHLAVTAHSWRPKMVALAQLRSMEVPIVMLTATLPLHMESELEVTMRCELSLTLLRAETTRTTTRYIVRTGIEDGKLMEEAEEVCRKQVVRLSPGSKMIVYCRSKSECEDLAESLGCDFFYSGSPDNVDAIRRWKDVGGCIVATTALGTGVSYDGVALTVHVGMPYGLIDFAQESGRSGRRGEVVSSLVLVEGDWQAREERMRSAKRREWSKDEKAMLEFINTDNCRRLVLAGYFDRKPAQDCKSGEMERCDRCGDGISEWARSERETSCEQATMEEALDQMANGCPVCWMTAALGTRHDWLHDGRTCTQRRRVFTDTGGTLDMDEAACDQFRETIRYLDGSKTCHACGISQKLCRTREAGQGGCQWPRMATAIVRLATTNTFGRNIIRQAGYGDEMADWHAYALWLGQPHRLRLWGELVSNSMVVIKEFLLYCKQEMGDEPWEADSIDDGDLAALEPTPSAVVDDRDEASSEDQCENLGIHGEIRPHEGATHRWRAEPRLMGAVLDVEELREMIDGWKEQCVLCRMQGRIARGHRRWSDCVEDVREKEKLREVIRVLEDIRFADFSHCRWCYRSQAICELWARSVDGQGRVVFRKRPGVDCKYGRWMLEAVAALLMFGADGDWEDRRRQDLTFTELKREMGSKSRRGEVEFSGLFAYFYRWA